MRQELITDLKPTLQKVYPAVYTGTSDLYCFFYARALQLLKSGGMLTFISSNKWFRAKYGEKLRKYIADTCSVHSITDFGELPVFKGTATFPMIFIGQNGKIVNQSTVFTQVKSLESPYPNILDVIREKGQNLPNNALNCSNWFLTDVISASRLQKMEAVGIPLGKYVNNETYRGILTGLNKAFIIDGAMRAKLISQDPNSAEIIKPLAVGNDVRKWRINYKDKWLIYSPWNLDINHYPAVKNHLLNWQKELKARPECQSGKYNWWCMARYGAEYVEAFYQPKIVYPEIAKETRFALDTSGVFVNNKAFIIATSELYLLGVLNSVPAWEYVKSICAALGDENKGGRLMLQWVNFQRLPIPNASSTEREVISKLVQKCLDAKGANCSQWEEEINARVAALYGL